MSNRGCVVRTRTLAAIRRIAKGEAESAGAPREPLVNAPATARLDEARRTGIPVPAPHSPEWAPEYEPTLRAGIRAEVTALLQLLR
jgi:hypothetical protein